MSIFGNIMNAIFHHPAAPQADPAAVAAIADPVPTTAAPAPAAAPPAPVDVEAVLTEAAQAKGEALNWRTSIVDLLKVLDLDSSLDARKQLANELDVHVAADGTAEENLALHKAVMQKLADNGGKVPDALKG